MCCDQVDCGADPSHPGITVGAPCCPASSVVGDSYSCGWCYKTGVATEITCSVADPHWRQSEMPCHFVDGGYGDSSALGGHD
jgi:hypothetical protein